MEERSIKKKLNNIKILGLSPTGTKIFASLVFMAIIASVFLIISFNKKPDNTTKEPSVVVEKNIKPVEDMNDIDVDDFDTQLTDMEIADVGRAHPFMPSWESLPSTTSIYGSLLAPPEDLPESTPATKIVTTKISGIMYDKDSPSAILNLEGQDYFVKVGDYINNYKILGITKDMVTVKLGSNVFKARVGQEISDGEMNYNEVYNLQRKFGGARE